MSDVVNKARFLFGDITTNEKVSVLPTIDLKKAMVELGKRSLMYTSAYAMYGISGYPDIMMGPIPLYGVQSIEVTRSQDELKYRAVKGVFLAHQHGGKVGMRIDLILAGPDQDLVLSELEFLRFYGDEHQRYEDVGEVFNLKGNTNQSSQDLHIPLRAVTAGATSGTMQQYPNTYMNKYLPLPSVVPDPANPQVMYGTKGYFKVPSILNKTKIGVLEGDLPEVVTEGNKLLDEIQHENVEYFDIDDVSYMKNRWHKTFTIITRSHVLYRMYIETLDVARSVRQGKDIMEVTILCREFTPPPQPISTTFVEMQPFDSSGYEVKYDGKSTGRDVYETWTTRNNPLPNAAPCKYFAIDPTTNELLNGAQEARDRFGILSSLHTTGGIYKETILSHSQVKVYEPTFKYGALDLKRRVEFKQRVSRETIFSEMVINLLHRGIQNTMRYQKTTNMLRDRSLRNKGIYNSVIPQQTANVKVHDNNIPPSPTSLFFNKSRFLKDNGIDDNLLNPFGTITNVFKNIPSTTASENKSTNFIQAKIRNDGITVGNTVDSNDNITNNVIKKLYNKQILDLKSSQYLYVDPNSVNVEVKKLMKHTDAYSITILENKMYFKYSPYSRTYMFYHISNGVTIPDYKNTLQSGMYCLQIKSLSNIYNSFFVILNIRLDGITELIYYSGAMLRKPVEEK